ncbi:ABC transporter substrate-binding protein [bacterium]|nr:ABC transporter substrate-binding protein [bacterium]
MKKGFAYYPFFAILALLVLFWYGIAKRPGKIVIGVIGPLTGQAAPYGVSHKNGIKLALDHFIHSGGIKNKKVEVRFFDDGNNKIRAAAGCRDLIYNDGALAIIGAISSDNTMNLQRICEKARVPLITAVSTNPFITRVNFRYSFRCLSDDDVQARALLQHTSKSLNLRRIAIIHDSNKYGSQGARTYESLSSQEGQLIVAKEEYEGGDTNFSAQLQRIRGSNPDGILVWGLFKESALIVRQIREMGIAVPIFGGDGMAVKDFLFLAGPSGDGVVLTFPFIPSNGGEKARDFVTKYKRAFGTEPDSFAAHAYDAFMILSHALVNSEGSPPSVREELAKKKEYEGVCGKGGFDSTGNETRPVFLAQVDSGQFAPMSIGEKQ